MPREIFIPPGGFLGFGQQTQATQALLRKKRAKKKRAKKKTAKKRPARRGARTKKRRATTRKKKTARLVKGSAAAKRHMAKLRRMRK